MCITGLGSGEDIRKILFKKISSILDAIGLQGVSLYDAPLRVYGEIAGEYYAMKLSEIWDLIGFLNERKMLKTTPRGINSTSMATIYAKSNQNSGVEVLSIFESSIKDPLTFRYYHEQMRTNPSRDKQPVLEYVDRESLQFMPQTILFEVMEEKLHFHPRLLKGISDILQEYSDERVPLASTTLTALYTSIIVAHEDMRIDYKNTSYSTTDYKYKNIIRGVVPRKGIPHDRDETKALQVFHKDMLLHEFDHSCPICGVNMLHMLIVSHTKPFCNCAYIYEVIDHDNDLLSCHNHDYLSDQGYFTFDENGYITFSGELLEKDNLDSAYSPRKDYRLAERYLSENRMKFMAYHRELIFHRSRQDTHSLLQR